MAEEQKATFPDLPVDQWWKLRNFFKSKLPGTANIEYLMSTLGISESTARNTLRNLNLLGLLDKDGKPTEKANEWRDDELYSAVCEDIRNQVYPGELLDVAQASNDRNAIESWFIRKTRIGIKAAKKNAAIFEVINDGDLTKVKDGKDGKGPSQPRAQARQRKPASPKPAPEPAPEHREEPRGAAVFSPTPPPLPRVPPTPTIHIDVQIHISPDAKPEQIDQIFASIAKHLYEPRQIGDGRTS